MIDTAQAGPDLRVALLNLQDGARAYPDFTEALDLALAPLPGAPGLMVITEARGWGTEGMRRGGAVTAYLRDRFRCPYQIRVGGIDRSDHPIALIWDPRALHLLQWWDPACSTTPVLRRNLAVFASVFGDLAVLPQHWHPASRDIRTQEADNLRMAFTCHRRRPFLGIGDFNCYPGADPAVWPDKDWERVPRAQRRDKGWQPYGPLGPWEAHTVPLDLLVGAWDPAAPSPLPGAPVPGDRVGGAGLHVVAEVDWHQRGRPASLLAPTTFTAPERGGPTLIDLALADEQMAAALVPGSYAVHRVRPEERRSDHALVTMAFRNAPGPAV